MGGTPERAAGLRVFNKGNNLRRGKGRFWLHRRILRGKPRMEATMANASQIKEKMAVKGSDGKHVGTVLGVENGRLKLISGGMDHDIDMAMIDAVEKGMIRLRQTADEAVKAWH
jgi:hypothetical protein